MFTLLKSSGLVCGLFLGVALLVIAVPGCGDSDNPVNAIDDVDDVDDVVDGEAIIADHTSISEFETLPAQTIEAIRQNLRFYYGHTSHGSQIMTGLNMLALEDSRYERPQFHEVGDDLGHNGDTSWAQITRDYLDAHPDEIDVVIWSWCGGVSDNTVEGINVYLNAMNDLENDYPDIVFVYMTGHLDGSGEDGNLRARNNQIREYCRSNDKVLFDFADIESYDPDGTYYPDETDACQWCSDWCGEHDCPACSSCAHSHCFNCYLKGKAFWCMMTEVYSSTLD